MEHNHRYISKWNFEYVYYSTTYVYVLYWVKIRIKTNNLTCAKWLLAITIISLGNAGVSHHKKIKI